MQKLMYCIAIIAFFVVFQSCNNDGTTKLSIRLTDAPADYEEVNVDIQSIKVHVSGDSTTESGWITLDSVATGVYNLLDLMGRDTALAASDLDITKISQIRLILGTNNTIKVDGVVYPLTTPSAQQSGLKIQMPKSIELDEAPVTLWLDFDADKSVKQDGNGYKLMPVLKLLTEDPTE